MCTHFLKFFYFFKVKLYEEQLKSFLDKNRRDGEKNQRDKPSFRTRREIWINVDGSRTTEVQNRTDGNNSVNADLEWYRQTNTHDV